MDQFSEFLTCRFPGKSAGENLYICNTNFHLLCNIIPNKKWPKLP